MIYLLVILKELIITKPLFKGEEAKMENKKQIPFQRDQLKKIFERKKSYICKK